MQQDYWSHRSAEIQFQSQTIEIAYPNISENLSHSIKMEPVSLLQSL